MDLAELDQMRDTIKNLQLDLKQSEEKYIKEISIKDKEISDLKSNAKVIIKHQNLNTYVMPLNSEKLANLLYHHLISSNGLGSYIIDYYTLKYKLEEIFKNKNNYEKLSNHNKQYMSESSTYDQLVNFDDVKQNIELKLRTEFIEDIEKYNSYIKTKEELEKDFNTKLNKELDSNNTYYSNKLDKLNKELDKIKEDHKKEISALHESYKSDDLKLEEVLSKMGYILDKGIFGIKLKKK